MVRASVVIVLQLRSFNSSTKVPTFPAMLLKDPAQLLELISTRNEHAGAEVLCGEPAGTFPELGQWLHAVAECRLPLNSRTKAKY